MGGGDWKQHFENIFRYPHTFILTGNVYHLWFLSSLLQGLFILWVSLCLDRFYIGLTIGVLLYLAALIAGTYSMMPFGYPVSFDMKNGPFLSTLFIVIGAGIAQGKYLTSKNTAIASAVFGFALCVAEVSFLQYSYEQPFVGLSVMIGIIPFAVGVMNLTLLCNIDKFGLDYIGRYSLGIYVIHPWIIEFLKLKSIHFLNVLESPLLFMGATLALSLLTARAFTLIPYLRRVVA